MACDASLPGHLIKLPFECDGDETRFQISPLDQSMSLCPFHYSLLGSIVLDLQAGMMEGRAEIIESLDLYIKEYKGTVKGRQRL